MPLHLTKVAVGCPTVAILHEHQSRHVSNSVVPVVTRYRPKRDAELVGGSLFWIIKHSLVVRQAIMGFDEAMTDKGLRCRILVDPHLVEVVPRARRAHQGWRYLDAADAPRDLAAGEAGMAIMPENLRRDLATLGLI